TSTASRQRAAHRRPGRATAHPFFYNLLPYREQQSVYNSTNGPGQNQVLAVFLCPSDSTGNGVPPAGAASGAQALGSYNYNLAVANNPNGGVFPPAAATMPRVNTAAAMSSRMCTSANSNRQRLVPIPKWGQAPRRLGASPHLGWALCNTTNRAG